MEKLKEIMNRLASDTNNYTADSKYTEMVALCNFTQKKAHTL